MMREIGAARASGGAVLLGEIHDNPFHHALRAELIPSKKAAEVFEQISADQQAALDQFTAYSKSSTRPATAADLKHNLDWGNPAGARPAMILSWRPW